MKYLSQALLLAVPVLALPSPFVGQERQAAACTLPAGFAPTTDAKLPDPFTKFDGTKVTTKAQWTCRAQEIFDAFQKYELGTKDPSESTVTGTFASNSITVSVSAGGKSISFSASIKYPSGTGPFPAIIAIGGSSLPIPASVATINFGNDAIAAQQNSNSHGTGKFFDLFGKSATAGALTGWAWGVSRLIDALEKTPTAMIDTKRLGVTGCSRNGKGAFIVGALDNRIALTLPQESGSGGAACWRISDSQKAAGKNIQTAGEIVGENAWFSPTFNTWATKITQLPVDHHELAALTVPRGLFAIENDIDWLGPMSTTACMQVGQQIYKAYGVPEAFGFSLVGGHSHCQFPSSQQADLTTYINKYLLGTGSISQVSKSSVSPKLSDYYSWTVPSLT
jgi:hypothetical protein